MPYLLIQTNRTVADRDALLSRASRTVAEALGKPERYVMVALRDETPMVFAGDSAPCVYMELKSIGLPAARTAALSSTLSDLIQEALGIGSDRVYIEFADAERHMWGFDGGTFA